MEKVDLQDDSSVDSERKENVELQDDESQCSGRRNKKVELRDDDSFEVISISCADSSQYLSDDCEDEDALVISINDSMSKSFPGIQLSSDLIQSAMSTTTIIPENGHISPKGDLTQEIKCESSSDDGASSSSLSEDDQPSSIVQVSEPCELCKLVLSTRHTSFSVPSLNIKEHLSDLQPLLEDVNVLDFHGKHAAVEPQSLHVFKKSSTTTWTACSSTAVVEKHSSENAVRMSFEGQNLHNNPQMLHSIFGGEPLRNSQLPASVPDFQVEGSNMANSVGTKKSAVKKDVSVSDLPKVQNSSVGIWGWLCPRNLLRTIVNKAWASIDAVITTLDPQMSSSYAKPNFEVLVATASDTELLPVQKAFKKTFLGEVSVQHLPVTLGCIPSQPVGFQSAVYCAESRIKFMRERNLVEKNKVIVATSPVLVEVTPLRWHHTICLMLDDPSLGLTLHTFTQTVPVPNIYANQVQLRTPADYHLKHLGFNITVGRVISIMTGIPENDWQYTMTGISSNKILESAAVVLAGMYKSYLNGVSY